VCRFCERLDSRRNSFVYWTNSFVLFVKLNLNCHVWKSCIKNVVHHDYFSFFLFTKKIYACITSMYPGRNWGCKITILQKKDILSLVMSCFSRINLYVDIVDEIHFSLPQNLIWLWKSSVCPWISNFHWCKTSNLFFWPKTLY